MQAELRGIYAAPSKSLYNERPLVKKLGIHNGNYWPIELSDMVRETRAQITMSYEKMCLGN